MEWDDATREDLASALNESDVVGVRLHPSERHVDVLLHVLSLPPSGPLAKDVRRILRLTNPSELRFLLRDDSAEGPLSGRPAIPLADLAAVEHFFGSLSWGGSSYGCRFFDDPGPTADWPADISLVVRPSNAPGRHTYFWFNECGVLRDGRRASYCIEGTITFDDLLVLDASGNELPIQTFIADGVRHWDALFAGDERMSGEAQAEAQQTAPKWRGWA